MAKPVAVATETLSLEQVQQLVRNLDPRYPTWFDWSEHNGIIRATPNRKLPMNAQSAISKLFRKLGGGFRYQRGKTFFEVTLPRLPKNRWAQAYQRLEKQGIYKD